MIDKIFYLNEMKFYKFKRKSIISKIKVEGELQEEFVDVEIDKAKLDFMKHQSNVNSANLEISNEMAEINSKLIEINTKIMSILRI